MKTRFLNFTITDILLETDGLVYDLHNALGLREYSYDVPAGTLTLDFCGEIFYGDEDVAIATDLRILFRGLQSIRIFDDWDYLDPYLESDILERDGAICSTRPPRAEAPLSHIVSLAAVFTEDDVDVDLQVLFTPAEVETKTWRELYEKYKDHLRIGFFGGPEFLISADTAEVSVVQSVRALSDNTQPASAPCLTKATSAALEAGVGELMSPLDAALLYATLASRVPMVRDLLGRGADPNVRLLDEMTPIMYVDWDAKDGPATFRALRDAGADLCAADKDGDTLLHDIGISAAATEAEPSRLALLRELVMLGVPVDQANNEGMTPLFVAAQFEDGVATLRVLLELGASAAARANDGSSPIHHPARWGYAKVVELLIGAGVDIDAQDATGSTALMYACGFGHEAVATLLIAAGADVALQDKTGATAAVRGRTQRPG